jgi:hypothetical protein
VGQALAARTYADLATATADLPAAPAQPPPPRRRPSPPARPPVTREAVKWGLAATGAMIPPALFVTALYGPHGLALLALPLLVLELPIVIIFVVITLARQRNDPSRASRGHLPPQPGRPGPLGQADRAGPGGEAERHGSSGPDPAPRGACAGQASQDLPVRRSRRDGLRRRGQRVPMPPGARPAPGAA